MFWLPLAIGSYFLSAFSSTADKLLLKKHVPQPAAYAFYSGLLSAGVLFLVPLYILWLLLDHTTLEGAFFLFWLPWRTMFLALFAGVWFVPALYFFYIALKRCDISRIVPLIGGMTPVVLIVLEYFFNGTVLSLYHVTAVILFTFGGFILATEVYCKGCVDTFGTHLLGIEGHRLQVCGKDTGTGLLAACGAAACFALTYFLSKMVYAAPTAFLPEFTWMRLGSVVGALLMLSLPFLKHDIHHSSRSLTRRGGGYVVANKVVGATSFILLNKAFDVGPIVIVNALKGFEYFFVFLFSMLLTVFTPRVLREPFDHHTIILKLLAIILISFGILFVVSA